MIEPTPSTTGYQGRWSEDFRFPQGYVGYYTITETQPGKAPVVTETSMVGLSSFRCGSVRYERQGVNTRGASVAIGNGEIINTNYTRKVTETIGGGGYHLAITTTGFVHHNVYTGSATAWWETLFAFNVVHPTLETEKLVSMAKMKALANIDRTRYSVLEDIAEWRSSVGTLSNPCKDILTNLRKLESHASQFFRDSAGRIFRKKPMRDGTVRAVRVSTKEIAAFLGSSYLSVKFGLAQLFYTAQTVGAEIEQNSLNHAIHRRTRRYKASGTAEDARSNTSSSTDSKANLKIAYTSEVSLEVRAGIIYEMKDPSHFNDRAWRYGLGYKEVVPIAWNLVSLSWFVDRLVDINSSIRAVENLLDPEVKIRAAWVTCSRKTQYTRHITNPLVPPGYTTFIVDGDVVVTKTLDHSRNVWCPSLFDVIPPVMWEDFLTKPGNVVDLSALVGARLGGVTRQLKKLGIGDLGFKNPYWKSPPAPYPWYRGKADVGKEFASPHRINFLL